MSVSGAEASLEKLGNVDLAACHGKSIEVHIVDMDVSVLMSLDVLGIDNIHLIEFLGAF